MIKKTIFALILLSLPCSLFSQAPAVKPAAAQQPVAAAPVLPPAPIIKEKLKTPDSEVEDYITWLQDINPEDREYIRGFTLYAVPKDLREETVLTLSFIIHSMTGLSANEEENSGAYYPIARANYPKDDKSWDGQSIDFIQMVPGSDTLFWIDIRNHNWTPQSWEKISKFDGYMVEPIIQHENNGLLRLLAGNALVRADWFIYHASRATEQTDLDKKSNSIYRELVYSKVKAPKTVDEFRRNWGVDVDRSRLLANEFATIVTKSKNVARHNRLLFGYRSELGWLYQTYDVKHEQGNRDYVEKFYEFGGKPPTVFDGGEIFATNQLRMQVYDIYDDKLNLVDFADATLVRHMSDILGDTRVVNPHSCFDCHAAGPIPSENTIADYIKNNGGLYLKDKGKQLRVDRAFSSRKFEDSVEENQELYKKALNRINGLTPEDNIKNYYKIITWYNKPVDLAQAAFECGVTEDRIKEKSKEGLQDLNNKIPARLAILLENGEAIPRQIWESPSIDGIPGTFQQTMIILNGFTKIVTEVKYVATVVNKCNIYKGGTEIIREVQPGSKISIVEHIDDNWSIVTLEDSTKGYISNSNIKKE